MDKHFVGVLDYKTQELPLLDGKVRFVSVYCHVFVFVSFRFWAHPVRVFKFNTAMHVKACGDAVKCFWRQGPSVEATENFQTNVSSNKAESKYPASAL